MKRRRDPVTWIYDHRAGVFSLVALTLAMAILFIGSRVVIRSPRSSDGIIVDMRTAEELQQEIARRERENRMLRSELDARQIRNAVSNEGADPDRSPDVSSVSAAVDRTNDNLRGNRNAWDEGLRRIDQMRNEDGNEGDADRNSRTDTKAVGTVQISFSLVNPTRYSAYLYNPGYRCETGGEVTVAITVDQNGDVIAASVDRSVSTENTCMHETALDAARRSRFDVNTSAPARHTGTITYIFIPQ
jgi:TonB family protein